MMEESFSRHSMRKMHITIALAAFAVVLPCGLADLSAHHPFSATYLYDERATIEGDVVALVHRMPHPYVHVTAPDGGHHVRRWAVEWGQAGASGRAALIDQLRVGDHVVVTGNPARDPGEFRLLMRSIVRPRDGWRWDAE
jgi:hypothetical protein